MVPWNLSCAFNYIERTNTKRVIPVCILNDEREPVQTSILRKLTHDISAEFDAHTGIQFREVEFHTYPDNEKSSFSNFYGNSADLAYKFWNICSQKSELVFVFTNQSFFSWAGQGSSYFGYVVITTVDRAILATPTNPGYIPPAHLLFKHELGHVFGLSEDKNQMSFMHTGYFGDWTTKIIKQILKNKDRTWHREVLPQWLTSPR